MARSTNSGPLRDKGKAQKWERHLAAWGNSGLSQAAFCRRHELSYAQFQWWKRRLNSAGATPKGCDRDDPKPAFIPVQLPAPSQTDLPWACELIATSGLRIRLRACPADAQWRALLRALAEGGLACG